jgi:hypothetical protein
MGDVSNWIKPRRFDRGLAAPLADRVIAAPEAAPGDILLFLHAVRTSRTIKGFCGNIQGMNERLSKYPVV